MKQNSFLLCGNFWGFLCNKTFKADYIGGTMEFKRFVSYMYEYRNNEKQQNCGFAKVEVRQNMVKFLIHMHLPGKREVEYKIYGFTRKKQGLEGIFLGLGRAKNGVVDVRIHMDAERLGDGNISEHAVVSMEDLAGILVKGADQSVCGTVWDDGDINLSQFSEYQYKEEEKLDDIVEESIEIQEINENIILYEEKEIYQENHREHDILDWDALKRTCPGMVPFEVPREGQYLRMEPKDLKHFEKKYWYLGNNSFLLHGYYNYRYLIVGKEKNGIILGIPGTYYPREERVAAMFGFPAFLPAQKQSKGDGRFGYWCRFIND